MWSYKKHKRLFNSLQHTRSQLFSTRHQYRQMRKYVRPTRSLEQEVRALKRRVSRNTSASYSFRQSLQYGPPAVAGTYSVNTDNFTNNFVNSSTYHDNVTGDWYLNKNLQLKMTVASDILRFRVIIYKPRRVGTTFSPALNAGGFVSHPDAAAFQVLRDITSDLTETGAPRTITTYINLKNMRTCFDTDTNLIEQGEIKMCVIMQSNTLTSGVAVTYGTMLTVADK